MVRVGYVDDGAHVEARTYEEVGADEVALGIELLKNIFALAYGANDLVAKLKEKQKRRDG